MNSHRILAAALALILSTVAGAQGLPTKQIRVDSTLMILNAMTVEDYMNMELPPGHIVLQCLQYVQCCEVL